MEKPWLKRTQICTNTEDKRCIIRTWCTPELQKAVMLVCQQVAQKQARSNRMA